MVCGSFFRLRHLLMPARERYAKWRTGALCSLALLTPGAAHLYKVTIVLSPSLWPLLQVLSLRQVFV